VTSIPNDLDKGSIINFVSIPIIPITNVKEKTISTSLINADKYTSRAKIRQALIISNFGYNNCSHQLLVCPIIHISENFPLHVRLNGIKTTGVILCDHISTFSQNSKDYFIQYVEKLPDSLLEKVYDIVLRFF